MEKREKEAIASALAKQAKSTGFKSITSFFTAGSAQ
jgi:hypothetical protein